MENDSSSIVETLRSVKKRLHDDDQDDLAFRYSTGPVSIKNELIEKQAELAFRGGFPGLRVKPFKVNIDLSTRYIVYVSKDSPCYIQAIQ